MNRHKETPVRNHPGIYKEHKFCEESGKWIETGKYRAIRRVHFDGLSKREQKMCDSLEEARNFRFAPREVVTVKSQTQVSGLTFEDLVKEWQPFHYLKLEHSTKQTYDKRLPNLDFLRKYPVEEIKTAVIDELVQFWVRHLPKKKSRENFEKELNLLKVILHFYKKRRNPAYLMPVLLEHYQAADIAKKAEAPVQSLSQEELLQFLEELRTAKCGSLYYPLALAQFCLGLRIGEACGLNWDGIDLEKRIAKVEWTIVWDHLTWEPIIKKRPKNGKVRMLVIPEVLAQELEKLRANRDPSTPLVFHIDGKPFNRQVAAKAYNRALERLGFDHVRGTHMLRKTSATLANEITGDFYAVSKLMDHSNPNVTLRYVSQTGVQKRKVAEALNSVLSGKGSSPSGPDPETAPQPTAVPKSPDGTLRPRLFLVKTAG